MERWSEHVGPGRRGGGWLEEGGSAARKGGDWNRDTLHVPSVQAQSVYIAPPGLPTALYMESPCSVTETRVEQATWKSVQWT
jgi:hypothetical protein